MRILVSLKNSPNQRYLVNLVTQSLIKEVRKLIENRKHSQAMAVVVSKGAFEREVSEKELAAIDADLILTASNARWDLTKQAGQ